MQFFIVIFLLLTTAFGWEHTEWLKQAEHHLDEEAITWLRQQINPEVKKESTLLQTTTPCKNCIRGTGSEIEEPKLLVFISFSVPENIWLSLAQEIKKYKGVFVLRGLPDNSFKCFAQKMALLKEKGMEAAVQIHPKLFQDYAIDRVPTFIFERNASVEKISGAISIRYAFDFMGEEVKDVKKSSKDG